MALVTDSRRVNGLVAFVVVVLAILAAPTTSRATVFTVTNTGDSSTIGSGSLRDAINQANGGTGNSIAFNIAGPPPFVISPASQLPGLIKDESIDGGGNVIIDGSGAGANAIGLWSESNGGNVIKGLTIRSFGGVGVDITSPNNTYGGTTALARDVISGNGGGG